MGNNKFDLPEDLKEITDFGFQVSPQDVTVYPPDILVLTLNHYPLEALAKLFASLETTKIRYYDVSFDGVYQTRMNPDGTITCSPYSMRINGELISRTPIKLKILMAFESINWRKTDGNT